MANKPLSNYWNGCDWQFRKQIAVPRKEGKLWHFPTAKAAPPMITFCAAGPSAFFSFAMNVDLKLLSSIDNGVAQKHTVAAGIGCVEALRGGTKGRFSQKHDGGGISQARGLGHVRILVNGGLTAMLLGVALSGLAS
jgi:hypothetical protein